MTNVVERKARLLRLYETMLLIRRAEQELERLFKSGRIPGFIHVSIGQEATATGIADALGAADTITSTHRGHGHALAKGMNVEALFHEILGNEEGPCRGRGGSLHVADFTQGMLGANGIVGGGIGIAVGSALSHKVLRTGRVAIALFGDGALAEGIFYESLNLAKIWSLPILFVCENNGWAEFSPSVSQYAGKLSMLADTFGAPYRQVDGNDAEVVADATAALLESIRSKHAPAILECVTRRVQGHYVGDPQGYRKGVAERDVADPIAHTRQVFTSLGFPSAEIEDVNGRVDRKIEAALAAALAGHPAKGTPIPAHAYEGAFE